jgi:pimeloyl-ACP methyl ester carboxylesterase
MSPVAFRFALTLVTFWTLKPSGRGMTTFLLVHGTFAREAEWTQPNSALQIFIRKAVIAKGDAAIFAPVPWSGRNRTLDRLAAADEIAAEITAIKSQRPTEKIFLIGHSHGGSAMSYFLKKYEQQRLLVQGAIFLSTPFIALKEKRDLDIRVRLNFYIISFAICFVVFLLARYLFDSFGSKDHLAVC